MCINLISTQLSFSKLFSVQTHIQKYLNKIFHNPAIIKLVFNHFVHQEYDFLEVMWLKPPKRTKVQAKEACINLLSMLIVVWSVVATTERFTLFETENVSFSHICHVLQISPKLYENQSVSRHQLRMSFCTKTAPTFTLYSKPY